MLSLVAYLLYASCLFTLAFDAVSGSRLDKYSKAVSGERCYECHFHYATESYQQCREPTEDGGTRGAYDCTGKCYVRMDPNGYVYRGCASDTIFPGIDSYRQGCSHQGYPRSLWWFCNGHLCNKVDLIDLCKDPNYPTRRYFNICDGHCRDPTGSYPDPHNSSYHIQCGFDSFSHRPCPCCKQYHLKCPQGTKWEDNIKQCVSTWREPIVGQGYKYGFQ